MTIVVRKINLVNRMVLLLVEARPVCTCEVSQTTKRPDSGRVILGGELVPWNCPFAKRES